MIEVDITYPVCFGGQKIILKFLEILKCKFKIVFFRNILLSALLELLSIMKDLSCLGIRQKCDCNDGSLVAENHQSNILEGDMKRNEMLLPNNAEPFKGIVKLP